MLLFVFFCNRDFLNPDYKSPFAITLFEICKSKENCIYPFLAHAFLLSPKKTSENQTLSDILGGYNGNVGQV